MRKTDVFAKEFILIIVDVLEELKALETYYGNSTLMLVISTLPLNNDIDLNKYFVVVTTQAFSGRVFTLLRRARIEKFNLSLHESQMHLLTIHLLPYSHI